MGLIAVGHIDPDLLNRDVLLNQSQNLTQLPDVDGFRHQGIPYQGVVPIDHVRHPVPPHMPLPDEHGAFPDSPRDGLAPMPVHGDRPSAGRLRNPPEVVLESQRRPGHRFPNINVPFMVVGIGKVNLEAGQFVMLLLLKSQIQPVTRKEEPSISIDVEALLGVPSGGPGRRAMFLHAQAGVMWQDIGGDRHPVTRFPQAFGREPLRGGVVRKERVPRLDRLSIEPD